MSRSRAMSSLPNVRRPSWAVLVLVVAGCQPKPARIELTTEPLGSQIEHRDGIDVPRGRVLDEDGKEIAGLTPSLEVNPPGIVEVRDGRLIPRNPGNVTVTLRAGGAVFEQAVRFRPPDRLDLRCQPRCEGKVGDTLNITLDVFSGKEPVFPDTAVLSVADSKVAMLRDGKLRFLGAGTTTITAQLGELTTTQSVSATNTVDKVVLKCPTVFQVVKAADGAEMDICYLLRGVGSTVRAQAFAGEELRLDERIRFDVLDNTVADVFEAGRLLPKKVGQTTLKASLASDGFVFGQMGLYVDDGDRYGRWVVFRNKQCRDPNEFTQVAYAWLPERETPMKLRCLNSTSISCLASGSAVARGVGRADDRSLTAWAEACCCVRFEATSTTTGLNGENVRYVP